MDHFFSETPGVQTSHCVRNPLRWGSSYFKKLFVFRKPLCLEQFLNSGPTCVKESAVLGQDLRNYLCLGNLCAGTFPELRNDLC